MPSVERTPQVNSVPKQILWRRFAISGRGSEGVTGAAVSSSRDDFVQRFSEWRFVELASGSYPKNTLLRVFQNLRRTARNEKFMRMSERFVENKKPL